MIEATFLYRQIHPSFVQNGRVTSQAFRPMTKDKSLLSVYNGDLITAESSYAHYTTELKFVSGGTMAVTCGECRAEALTARPDPKPFPEHAVIDFEGLSDAQCEKKGKKLRVKAQARDWVYRPAGA